jgi:hypothetical protein
LSLNNCHLLRALADLARPDDDLDLGLKPDTSLDGPAEQELVLLCGKTAMRHYIAGTRKRANRAMAGG